MDTSAHHLVLPRGRVASRFLALAGRSGLGLGDVRGLIREARTFGLIGIANAVADTVLFSVLHAGVGVGPLSAKIVSGLITIIASYYANRRWTWPHRPGEGQQRRQLIQFSAISFGGLLLAEGCLAFSHYVLGLHSLVADNLAANVVGLGLGTVWRFLASRRWVFTPTPESTPVTEDPAVERLSRVEDWLGGDWTPTLPISSVQLQELLPAAKSPTGRIR